MALRLYSDTLELLAVNHGVLPEDFRVRQACNALHAVAVFNASVAQFLESQSGEAPDLDALSGYPKTLYLSWKRDSTLQGVATKQKAAVYGKFREHFEMISGPESDYGCLLDLTLQPRDFCRAADLEGSIVGGIQLSQLSETRGH